MKTCILKIILSVLLVSCSIPEEMRTDKIPPVENFKLGNYLGKWYEIARLPNSFEEGLIKVTAEYSLDEDNDIIVINRGFDSADNKWSQAEGIAKVKDPKIPAELEVSFFRPFYADYKIIKIDPGYRLAMVTSSSKKYLWILSRTARPENQIIEEYISFAKTLGFDTSKLIMVEQD